jgi:hypothetical protein
VASAERLIPSPVKLLLARVRGEWLFVLDLDRTIFNTALMYTDLTEMIKQTWGTEVARAMRDHEAVSEHLDPFQYLQDSHGIDYDKVVNEFARFTAHKYPDGHSYLYPDVPKLLDYLKQRPRTTVRIVTTGTPLSQKFKLAQCPELKWIEPQIITGNKGDLFEAAFQKTRAITLGGRYFQYFVLVDDKNTALTPIAAHDRRLLIHLLRPDAKFSEHTGRSDVREITSLDEIPAIVR